MNERVIKEFFWFCGERWAMWERRQRRQIRTKDPTLYSFWFPNLFRWHDKGTIALVNMIAGQKDLALVFWNIYWYRRYNLSAHAKGLGWCDDYEKLEYYFDILEVRHKPIFARNNKIATVWCESKEFSTLDAIKDVWKIKEQITEAIIKDGTLEGTSDILKDLYLTGRFLSYEMALDLRYTVMLPSPPDASVWGFLNSLCQHALRRMGLSAGLEGGLSSLRAIYDLGRVWLPAQVRNCYPNVTGNFDKMPYFETAEVIRALSLYGRYLKLREDPDYIVERFNLGYKKPSIMRKPI